jgi:hypothetical protein
MDTLPGAFNLPRAIMLRKRYLCVARRQEKSRILDRYCANTGQNRKYTTRKIRPSKRQAPRSVTYLASLEDRLSSRSLPLSEAKGLRAALVMERPTVRLLC